MANPQFEIGFAQPSLDNPILFGKYADSLAARLRQRYGQSAGYRVMVEKRDRDPKKRSWTVNVFGGWFSGAKVEIKPKQGTPHRAVVTVSWDSRLQHLFLKLLALVTLLVFV